MVQLYLTAHTQDLLWQIAEELVVAGLTQERLRIVAAKPERAGRLASVKTIRYRPARENLVLGALVGGSLGFLVGLPLLWLGAFGLAPLLVVIVMGVVGGGVVRLWYGHGLAGEFYVLDDAMRRDEAAMVVTVEEDQVGRVARMVKDRHPEAAVLGTDPEGTPPFP